MARYTQYPWMDDPRLMDPATNLPYVNPVTGSQIDFPSETDTEVVTDVAAADDRTLPTFESGEPFALPERKYAPPVYRRPAFTGDVPRLGYTPMDRRKIDVAARRAGAGGKRKVQSAVDRALSYGLTPQATGETIANQGTALANVMAGAGRQGLGEVAVGKDYEFRGDVVNYDTQVKEVFGQYRDELNAAKRNYSTLSGVYDYDLSQADKTAKRNFDTRIRELELNFEAQLRRYLLSGVKTETIIYDRG